MVRAVIIKLSRRREGGNGEVVIGISRIGAGCLRGGSDRRGRI